MNVNGSDDISKLATTFNPNEIAYFKKIVELLMTKDRAKFELSTTDALNASGNIPGVSLSKSMAEKIIHRFVDDKWLELR